MENSCELFKFDKNFNTNFLIGTDETGRGPGAGGVFASAVYFKNIDNELIEKLCALNDSKKLSKKKREELYEIILENTINSTVCVEVEEIEKINILNASLKAMKLACSNVILNLLTKGTAESGEACDPVCETQDLNSEQLCDPESGLRAEAEGQNHTFARKAVYRKQPSINSGRSECLILVDGNKPIKSFPCSLSSVTLNINQQCVIKGDAKSASIAAASILAKVSRDIYMEGLDKKFPQYNWKQNAGYLTQEHLNAIDKYGLTAHHRKSFLKKHEEKVIQITLNLTSS